MTSSMNKKPILIKPQEPKVIPEALLVSPRNIENYKQFKVLPIQRDLATAAGVPEAVTGKILMARGVIKAFNIRIKTLGLQRLISDQLRRGYKAIENKLVKRPNSKKIPAWVKAYYIHIGRLETLEHINRQLSGVLDQRGWQLPKSEPRFERTLRVRGKDLLIK